MTQSISLKCMKNAHYDFILDTELLQGYITGFAAPHPFDNEITHYNLLIEMDLTNHDEGFNVHSFDILCFSGFLNLGTHNVSHLRNVFQNPYVMGLAFDTVYTFYMIYTIEDFDSLIDTILKETIKHIHIRYQSIGYTCTNINIVGG